MQSVLLGIVLVVSQQLNAPDPDQPNRGVRVVFQLKGEPSRSLSGYLQEPKDDLLFGPDGQFQRIKFTQIFQIEFNEEGDILRFISGEIKKGRVGNQFFAIEQTKSGKGKVVTDYVYTRKKLRTINFFVDAKLDEPKKEEPKKLKDGKDRDAKKGTTIDYTLYFLQGAHFAYLNDFGDGPYMSSSRYAKVSPGMKLTVHSDGYWKLEYRMLSSAGPARVSWDVHVRFLDDFGMPREVPLQTFLRHVRQSKDTGAVQEIWHDGRHLAIRDYFANICTTGCLVRKGHVQFETDHDLDGEK